MSAACGGAEHADSARWPKKKSLFITTLFSEPLRQVPNLAMERGYRQRRLLQGEAFDGLLDLVRQRAPLTAVGSSLPGQSSQAELPILSHPTLRGSQRNSRCRRYRPERTALLKVRPYEAKPIQRQISNLFTEPSQLLHIRTVRQIACKVLRQLARKVTVMAKRSAGAIVSSNRDNRRHPHGVAVCR